MDNKSSISLRSAYVAAILQIFIIGFSFTFVKLALKESSSLDLLAHRFTFAFIACIIPLLIGKKKIDIHKPDFIKILPLAFFYPICMFLFQTIGLIYLPSSQAGIIQATVPIFTLILAGIVLGERSTYLQKIFVLISVGGILYISFMGKVSSKEFSAIGMLLIILSTISNAMYNVLSRKMVARYPVYTLSFVMITIGFIGFNTMAIGYHLVHGNMVEFILPLKNPIFLISAFYLGALSSFMTSVLNALALTKIEASKIGVFSNIVSVISFAAGVIILREKIFYYHYIGMAFTLVGAIGTNLCKNKSQNKDTAK